MIEIHALAAPVVYLVAGTLMLLWALHYLHLSYLADRVRIRMEARLTERERIARELHDTVLQGFQGLVLRFQAAVEEIQLSNAARKPLEDAIDLANKVLSDGRDRVVGLRAGDDSDDISQLVAAAATRCLDRSRTAFALTTAGEPRQLHPLVREEVLSIAQEAVANAARHADADNIEVQIAYFPRELRVCVKDNGVGIDPAILASGGRKNHFGMIGMHERADKINALCAVTSKPGYGTQVTLSVPTSIAYHRNSDQIRDRFRNSHVLMT
jgi:signal transduction histidine kinase